MVSITCLGSCVSRVSLLRGEQQGHGIFAGEKKGLKLRYFFDKQNIALAMMPPPDRRLCIGVDRIPAEELWDKSRLRSLQQAIKKETLPLLLAPEPETENYLVLDFYDFHNSFVAYGKTAFAHQAAEFLNTQLYRKNAQAFTLYRSFFELPAFTYYPLVALFFARVLTKYDADHIILLRFRSNTHLLRRDGSIVPLPERVQQHFQSNQCYNAKCRELEDYVISRVHPYVIDLSKYFFCDENFWPTHIHGAHYEEEFYRESYDQILRIVKHLPAERYFDAPRFFDRKREGYAEDAARELDVFAAFHWFEKFAEEKNPLALNILDKLVAKAPQHPKVRSYLDLITKGK